MCCFDIKIVLKMLFWEMWFVIKKKKVYKDMGFKGWWDEGGVFFVIDKFELYYIYIFIIDFNFRNYYIFQIFEIV